MKGRQLRLWTGLIGSLGVIAIVLFLNWRQPGYAFIQGLLAASLFAGIILLVHTLWNAYAPQTRTLHPVEGKAGHPVRQSVLLLGSASLLTAGVVGAILIYQKTARLESLTQLQETQILELDQLTQQARNGGRTSLISNLLQSIDADLAHSAERALSISTIERIATVCYFLTPYRSVSGGRMTEVALSPERGFLLLTLVRMRLDSSTMDQILRISVFNSADLQDADLRDAALDGVQLNYANLKGAQLSGATLRRAQLYHANLWGAHMDSTVLFQADLKRADLSWATLNYTDLTAADLSGAMLASAQIRQADLREVMMQWADCSHAFLNGTQFQCADLRGTSFAHAFLPDAQLTETNLTQVIFLDTDMTGAEISDADFFLAVIPGPEWLNALESQGVKGVQDVRAKYTSETFSSFGQTGYRLNLVRSGRQ